MIGFSRFRCLCAAFLLLSALPARAAAQAPDQNAAGTASILKPLTLQKRADMDFGYLAVGAAGTAVINPHTGAITTTGGVMAAGGSPTPARFVGVSARNTPVIIRLPKNAITLTRSGGTETVTLNNWTTDGPTTRHVSAGTPFEFRVGGTLAVGANQVEGTYVGTFNVSIQYP
ncbi:MAG TPA: DUF4402 domain-containing protein [Sphingomicrobium sp.]|nr:DUF4402 domain-containing protein [Sphingomicrobium sp.]